MFVCTFRYRPKHVACYLCTEYKQKQGVRFLSVPGWLSGLRPEWWGIRRR